MFLPTVLLASFVAVPGPDLEIRAGGRLSGSWGEPVSGVYTTEFYLVI